MLLRLKFIPRQAMTLFLVGIVMTYALPSSVHASTAAAATSLQQLINQANNGDILRLSSQEYEGPAVINKSLTIQMEEGGLIRNRTNEPTLTLTANNIQLFGLRLTDEHTDPKLPAILIASKYNRLELLQIDTQAGGIYLRNADHNVIRSTHIQGKQPTTGIRAYSHRGNGIDLLASEGNTIESNVIDYMHDGVYAESSNHTTITQNRVDRSRYGYHLMFSGKPLLSDNVGSLNVTGAMIMGVESALVTNNRFDKQNENVNSQGILLYDVHHSDISSNRVEGNRVGLYIENATENTLSKNEVKRNFIGLQMLSSNRNVMSGNSFLSNVIQAQSTNSQDNRLDGNYWDDNQGLDLQGDGESDLSYEIDPFFLQLTEDIEAYQVFFQSPGMPFLQQMFHTNTDNWLKDNRPLMKTPASVSAVETSPRRSDKLLFLLALILLLLSILSIYKWGYKINETNKLIR